MNIYVAICKVNKIIWNTGMFYYCLLNLLMVPWIIEHWNDLALEF